MKEEVSKVCCCNNKEVNIKYESEYFLEKRSEDSGYDVRCWEDKVVIPKGQAVKIKLGIKLEIPEGYEAQLRPRSGLNAKGIVGLFGTIDSGYRGEVCAVLFNLSGEYVTFNKGDRVAQLVFAKVENTKLDRVLMVSDNSERGESGFGSSGLK